MAVVTGGRLACRLAATCSIITAVVWLRGRSLTRGWGVQQILSKYIKTHACGGVFRVPAQARTMMS